MRKTPEWFYGDTLDLDFDVASHIAIEQPQKPEEAGTLYVEVDNGGDRVTLVLGPEEVNEIREYLNDWYAWAEWNGYA